MNGWNDYPRLRQLRDESYAAHHASIQNYFHYLESRWGSPAAVPDLVDIEGALSQLDEASWRVLLNKAMAYVTSPDRDRGWYQLISTLNEAKGYGVLQQLGYPSPQFIPESQARTPDLRGDDDRTTTFVEVKTIQPSSEEIGRIVVQRREGRLVAVSVPQAIPAPFRDKLAAIIAEAAGQLRSVTGQPRTEKVLLLVVTFDCDAIMGAHYWPQLQIMARELRPADIQIYLNHKGSWCTVE